MNNNFDLYTDLVDYSEGFEEFLKKKFIEYHKDITEASERFADFYFFHSETFFIFNNDGTITIYNDWLPTITKGMDYYDEYLTIDMKELKPYLKNDSFYRYLFN